MGDPDYTWPRETVEPIFFSRFLINGSEPMLAEWQLVKGLARPIEEEWRPCFRQNDMFAFRLTGTNDPGQYKVFARVPDNPDRTVIEVGEIELT